MNGDDLLIVHTRHPDDQCSIEVWFKGVPVQNIYEVSLDPGSGGMTKTDYDQDKTETVGQIRARGPEWDDAASHVNWLYTDWEDEFARWGMGWDDKEETA